MNKFLLIASSLALAASVSATPINITVGVEDELLSPGGGGQAYDLEAFLFDDATDTLSIVSGFDVFDIDESRGSVTLGDVFIDIDHNSTWDYVIDFNQGWDVFTNTGYTVVDLSKAEGLVINGVANAGHDEADPYSISYDSYNGTLTPYFFTQTTWNDAQGDHFQIDLDLSEVPLTDNFQVHLTEECGNDYMTGSVPEPTLISLLGFGLVSLAFFRRKK